MRRPLSRENGNAIIEFTLVGIPLMFVLISIFEMARGVWVYTTLAHAVREGARYAAVHGKDCSTLPNNCAVTVAQVSAVIRDAGVGLQPTDFRVALIAAAPRTIPAADPTLLSTLLTDPTTFPSGDIAVAGNDIVVVGVYSFRTALVALFSPPPTGGDYGAIQFRATSRERIEF